MESAFIDGASHFQIFWRLILPLSVPALAAFAIFQFLWVWNDYLVALIFIGAKPDNQVVTQRLAEIVGSRGDDWHLLTAGAFVSMLLPLLVFFCAAALLRPRAAVRLRQGVAVRTPASASGDGRRSGRPGVPRRASSGGWPPPRTRSRAPGTRTGGG